MQDTCGPLLSIDNTIEGTTLNKCWKLMTEVAGKMGVDLAGARKYKAIMESIGFVDVKEVVLEWPFGTVSSSLFSTLEVLVLTVCFVVGQKRTS